MTLASKFINSSTNLITHKDHLSFYIGKGQKVTGHSCCVLQKKPTNYISCFKGKRFFVGLVSKVSHFQLSVKQQSLNILSGAAIQLCFLLMTDFDPFKKYICGF